MRSSWRWSTSLREAMLNLLPFGGRGFLELAAAVALGSSLAAAHAAQWRSLDRELSRQAELGRHVLVISADRPDHRDFRLRVASCDALASVPGVARAGAVVDLGLDEVAQLGGRVPVVGVSAGLLPLGAHQAVVGAALAASSNLDRASARVLGTRRFGPLRGRVAAPQPVGVDLDGSLAVLLDRATTTVPSCVVQLDPLADEQALTASLQASVTATNGDVAVRPAVQLTFDVLRSFRSRPLRLLDVLVGLLGGCFAALARRLRASEVAAYRTSGTGRLALSRITWLETVCVAGCFATSGTAALLGYGLTSSRLASSVAWLLAGAAAWLTTVGCLHLLTVAVNPLRLARDR